MEKIKRIALVVHDNRKKIIPIIFHELNNLNKK